MADNIKFLDKEMQKAQSHAADARRQAETERNKAGQYDPATQQGDVDYHNQQAERFDEQAQAYEDELKDLEPRKQQVEARITELRSQRETIEREMVDKITAIDRELSDISGSLTI